jgi:hypothetical protein
MRSHGPLLARRGFIAASIVAFAFFGYGCGGGSNSSFSAQFTASATATAPHLIKLVQKSHSGGRVVVQAVIYGPDASLDMFTFAFDVKIGDTTVLKFVPGSAVAGDALQACPGQTITALAAPDGQDPTHIVVGVTMVGGCAGNGVANASAVVVSLTFQVLKQGTSTLAIAAGPTAPSVLDSSDPPQPIAGLTFDTANGTVTAISTGGGY